MWTKTLQDKLEARTASVSVIGLGYVGLSLAVELAKSGFVVRGIDLDLERVNLLNRGESYLVDVATENLAPLVAAGRLSASTRFEDAGAADAIVICVPTPLRKSKEPDISFILSAVESLLPHLRRRPADRAREHDLPGHDRGGGSAAPRGPRPRDRPRLSSSPSRPSESIPATSGSRPPTSRRWWAG